MPQFSQDCLVEGDAQHSDVLGWCAGDTMAITEVQHFHDFHHETRQFLQTRDEDDECYRQYNHRTELEQIGEYVLCKITIRKIVGYQRRDARGQLQPKVVSQPFFVVIDHVRQQIHPIMTQTLFAIENGDKCLHVSRNSKNILKKWKEMFGDQTKYREMVI